MKTSIDFNRFNPFRRPDWRFERVLRMVDRIDGKPGRCTPKDDEYVRGLRRFILRYKAATDPRTRETLAAENYGLYFAFLLHEAKYEEEGKRKCAIIEARLLADQPDEIIAEEICTMPEAIEWYEAIFFHVRDRLTAHDWIIDHVLIPSLTQSAREAADHEAAVSRLLESIPLSRMAAPFFDCTLKFFAYFGGHFILDYVLSGFKRGNLAYSRDEISNWFDSHFQQKTRHRSSVAMSVFKVDEDNVMQLFSLHTRLIEIERNSDTAENKQDQLHRAMGAFLKEIPWAVGRAGADLVAGTAVEKYDNSAAELRDDEAQLLSVGENTATIEGIELLEMPKPRRLSNDEAKDKDVFDANAEQTS